MTATTTPGSRSALEHLARLAADELENVESFAQHLGRQNLDGDARQRLGKRLSDGFSPLIRRNRLLSLRLCGWRRQRFAAESKVENGERELRVILRQALRFLAEQAELQALDLLLQQQGELLVLVALTLELGAALLSLR
ncbi:MAG TPA: hypothetical protein VEQ59_08430 [Polyangiaceae bacterium]|nr:hypothetical protein [Polyangiaceae bacterium]